MAYKWGWSDHHLRPSWEPILQVENVFGSTNDPSQRSTLKNCDQVLWMLMAGFFGAKDSNPTNPTQPNNHG